MRRAASRDGPAALWALLSALLILGPGLGPGFLLVRDMVWVPDLALTPGVLGLGSGLPRAVPSDAVVAVVDELVPGMVLQKLVLLLTLAAAGVGASRLTDRSADTAPVVVRLVSATIYTWSPLVAERLLMGAWPLLVGYAVLPWLLIALRRWRAEGRLPIGLLVLVPLGCLSASAGLATSLALLLGGSGRGRTAKTMLLIAAGNAPWVVAGLLHASSATSDPAAASVFALRSEGSVPAPLAALTLGGIWNTAVQPDSRTGLLGWVALVALAGLAAVGARSWWGRARPRERTTLLGCWAAGWGLAVFTWLAPAAVGWAAQHIPGAGVARDGARALVLCAPLLAVLVAEGGGVVVAAGRRPRAAGLSLGVAAVLLPVALLPGLAFGVGGGLQPADYPASYEEARGLLDRVDLDGEVLVLPLSSYRAPVWNNGQPVLDPVGRFLERDYVASDVLVIDGVPLTGEDPRVRDAETALAQGAPEERAAALGHLGIGAVVTELDASGDPPPEVAGRTLLAARDLEVVQISDVQVREVQTTWLAAMTVAWLAFVTPLALAALRGVHRLLTRGPVPSAASTRRSSAR